MRRTRIRAGRLALFAAAGAALLALPVLAATRPPAYAASAESRPLTPRQRLERRFLQVSAADLRFQAEASRLVASRSGTPAVQALAAALLERQQAAEPELLRLLHARGMAWPITSADHGKVLRQLAKASGAKFDQLYVEQVVVRTYRADLANHEMLATQAEDPVLKAWVERQLPTLRSHLAQAGRALPNHTLRAHRAV